MARIRRCAAWRRDVSAPPSVDTKGLSTMLPFLAETGRHPGWALPHGALAEPSTLPSSSTGELGTGGKRHGAR